MAPVIKPDFFGLSDLGLAREENEDQFLCAELTKTMLVHQTTLAIDESARLTTRRRGYLFLVADGMGGAPAGERASSLAVRSVVHQVLGRLPWFFHLNEDEDDLENELKRILEKCRLKIEADVAEHPTRRGMGTTLTLAYVLWPRLYVVHVGDARSYLLRGTQLAQITKDHTLVAGIEGKGPQGGTRIRKLLWNVIGGASPEVWPDVVKLTLEDDDVLLLCTDGLTRHVSDQEIAGILKRTPTSRDASRRLVRAANEAGGKDNVTVVVARFGRRAPAQRARAHSAAIPSETGKK